MQTKKNSVIALARHKNPPKSSPGHTVEIAVIKGVDDDGAPRVHWQDCPGGKPQKALTQIKVTEWDLGRQCTIAFIGGEITRPIVMGLLYTPDDENDAPVIIQSGDAIILQSGASRIELHADGRINLQGLQINSQAYGPNRMKGASVKLN